MQVSHNVEPVEPYVCRLDLWFIYKNYDVWVAITYLMSNVIMILLILLTSVEPGAY